MGTIIQGYNKTLKKYQDILVTDGGKLSSSSSFNLAPASASATRPNDTTPYTALDVCGTSPATNLVFTGVCDIGSDIIINRVELRVDVAAIPSGMSGFRLHLYDTAPTALADNAAFNIIAADRTKYLGYIDFDTPQDFGDTLYIEMNGINFQCRLAVGSSTLYGCLQTIGAYTPTALAVKTIKIHASGV